MSTDDPQNHFRRRPVWQFRFGLGSMLIIMLVAAVIAAAGGYLVRSLNSHFRNGSSAGGRVSAQLAFILFTLAAPIFLMVTLSALRQIIRWIYQRPRRN